MDKKVGIFNLSVWEGGFPIWIEITDGMGKTLKFTADNLRDLEHLVKEAKIASGIK